MSDQDPWYLDGSKPSLKAWMFTQMAIGAGWGAIVFFGVVFFIFILVAISSRLPEDPFAMLDAAKNLKVLHMNDAE